MEQARGGGNQMGSGGAVQMGVLISRMLAQRHSEAKKQRSGSHSCLTKGTLRMKKTQMQSLKQR